MWWYLPRFEKNTNNENILVLREVTKSEIDRYSVFLYPKAGNTTETDSWPPAIEDYGCVLPPPVPRPEEDTTTYFAHESGTPAEMWRYYDGFPATTYYCPNYELSKLFPVAINPDNFLVKKIGKKNLTWYHAKNIASGFVKNGIRNSQLKPSIFGKRTNPNNPCWWTGFMGGPRYALISKNILITAAHYVTDPTGNQIEFVGTDDNVYTATIVDFKKILIHSADILIAKITGLEQAVDLGVLKPIATVDLDVDYPLDKLALYLSCLPVFEINKDNLIKLNIHERVVAGGLKSHTTATTALNFFHYKKIFKFLGIDDWCTPADMSFFVGVGDSSSMVFAIHDNTPILLKSRQSANDDSTHLTNIILKLVDSEIKKLNGEPRVKIKINLEDINKKISEMDDVFKIDETDVVIRDIYNPTVVDNNGIISIVDKRNFTVFQNLYDTSSFIFLSFVCFNWLDDGVRYPLNDYYYSPYAFSPNSFLKRFAFEKNGIGMGLNRGEENHWWSLFYANCPIGLTQIFNLNSNTFRNIISKSILGVYSQNKLKEFYKKHYYINKKIKILKNKKYKLYFHVQKELTNLNNFYITTEKFNKEKIYNELYISKPYYFNYDDQKEDPQYMSPFVQNLYDENFEQNLEKIIQPIDMFSGTFNSNVNVSVVIYFVVPEDCPSKLYLCSEEDSVNYLEFFLEDDVTTKKENNLSYLNIKPSIKNNKDVDILVGKTKDAHRTAITLAFNSVKTDPQALEDCWYSLGLPDISDPNFYATNYDSIFTTLYNNTSDKNLYSFAPANFITPTLQIKQGVSIKNTNSIDITRKE